MAKARRASDFRQSHCLQWLCCIGPLLFVLAACSVEPQPVQLAGSAMGTSWSVTYLPPAGAPQAQAVRAGIAAELEVVEQSMSTWRAESEISRFNRGAPGTWFELSAPFAEVLAAALRVGQASAGAFDVTVSPLVRLWGFGPGGEAGQRPAQEDIDEALAQVGQGGLNYEPGRSRLSKAQPLELDFSSIAKGYGVDRVADWLAAQQITDFLVEVGGELRLSGRSPRGDAWRIAVEQPDAPPGTVAAALALSDVAVATSGDYRNYFELEGRRYSHSIDPRSGWPVAHDLVSVTVVHSSAMLADAWATALTVLGSEQAARVAQQQDLAVYFIRRTDDGYSSSHSGAFEPYLAAGAAQ